MLFSKKMNRNWIIVHIIIEVLLSALIVYVIKEIDMRATYGDYISGVGSVASVYAIFVTFYQLAKVKSITEETHKAVMKKSKEIETLLAFADIERHLEMCSYISMCLQSQQYEAAALKMLDLKKVLIEAKSDEANNYSRVSRLQDLIRHLGQDIVAVRGCWKENEIIDLERIQLNLDSIFTYLQELSVIIKKRTYVR